MEPEETEKENEKKQINTQCKNPEMSTRRRAKRNNTNRGKRGKGKRQWRVINLVELYVS